MKNEVYRYSFDPSVPVEEIEANLTLAIVGVESLHGTSVMLLDVRHLFDTNKRAVVIEADTEAGRNLAQLFTGYTVSAVSVRAVRRDSASGQETEGRRRSRRPGHQAADAQTIGSAVSTGCSLCHGSTRNPLRGGFRSVCLCG